MNTKAVARFIQVALAIVIAFAVLAAAKPQSAQAASCKDTHTVKAGESIYSIAKKYETTPYKIAQANNMEKPYTVTVGEQLCIPKLPEPSSDYSWTATLKNGKVSVTGEDFKKSWSFFIKVREDLDEPWYKLGKVVTNKSGIIDEEDKLPKDLTNAKILYVCLKDGVTNYLDCKRVFKQ
jgi:spore germination protein YaaH